MRRIFILLALFLVSIASTSSLVYATGPCTICYDNTHEGDLTCSAGTHSICADCVRKYPDTIEVLSVQHARDLKEKGLPCYGERCTSSLPLAVVQSVVGDTKEMLNLLKRLEPGTEGACAAAMEEKSLEERLKIEFRTRVADAFTRGCPVCHGPLNGIEGCNAAKCQGYQCGGIFCNLCLARQANNTAAHAHALEHSGNYWEHRDGHTGLVPLAGTPYTEVEEYQTVEDHPQFGKRTVTKQKPYTYTDRYHWLLAREKLEHLFQEAMPAEVRAQALQELEPLLKANKMWPIPTASNTEAWTQAVIHSSLDGRNKVALLQNELIFLTRQGLTQKGLQASSEEAKGALAHRTEVIRAILESLKAPALVSLDIRHAPAPPRPQNGNISPVLEGGEGWDLVPERMRAMGVENIYRIHDPQPDPVHPVQDFILSHVAPERMNHERAVAYCAERGARLPTKEEYEALGRAMGRGQPGGYNPDFIPDMRARFWSSSVHPDYPYYAFDFNGSYGNVYSDVRNVDSGVRCVVGGQRG